MVVWRIKDVKMKKHLPFRRESSILFIEERVAVDNVV